jgi:hypothetical protein
MKHLFYPHGRARFVNPMEHGEPAVAGRIQGQWLHLDPLDALTSLHVML